MSVRPSIEDGNLCLNNTVLLASDTLAVAGDPIRRYNSVGRIRRHAATILQALLTSIISTYADRILAVDRPAAESAARRLIGAFKTVSTKRVNSAHGLSGRPL